MAKNIMKKTELQSIIREEIQNLLNEAFSNWEVKFTKSAKVDGVDIKKGHTETVKARGTSEAIKKACKQAGCEDAWMHVDVDVVKK
jgi:hypothetical protein